MYTPNELRDIRFGKAVFGGYDTSDVDRIFAAVSDDYSALFKENMKLKKNMKTLADAVENYRKVDEAMRKALITAQDMATEMVAEAEVKSRDMLATASAEAKLKIRELSEQIAAEEKRLSDIRSEAAEFIDRIAALYQSERDKFESLKVAILPEEKKEEESAPESETMSDTIDQISKSIEEKMRAEEEEIIRKAREAAEAAQVPQAETSEEDEDADVKRADDTIAFESKIPTEEEMDILEAAADKKKHNRPEFPGLKFGKDYDIDDED